MIALIFEVLVTNTWISRSCENSCSPFNNILINSLVWEFGNKFHLFTQISLAALVKFILNCVKFIPEFHAKGVD